MAMACDDEGYVGESNHIVTKQLDCSSTVGGGTYDDVDYAHNEQYVEQQIQIAPEQYIEMIE